jgi:hypothetical protein
LKKGIRFHVRQEEARRQEKQRAFQQQLNSKTLSSGWLQRQIADEEAQKRSEPQEQQEEDLDDLLKALEEEEDMENDPFLESYRNQRLVQLLTLSSKKTFGTLIEVSEREYVSSVEDERSDTMVLVHLYERTIEACRQVVRKSAPLFSFLHLWAGY